MMLIIFIVALSLVLSLAELTSTSLRGELQLQEVACYPYAQPRGVCGPTAVCEDAQARMVISTAACTQFLI